MWDWFRLRRRSRRRTQTTLLDEQPSDPPNTQRCWPFNSFFNTRTCFGDDHMSPWSFHHLMSAQQPKCLTHMPCSEILYGSRLEDFSQDCWLEDHLHRFGGPSTIEASDGLPLIDDTDDSITGSNNDNSTLESIDYDMFDINNTQTSESAPRLALEELFIIPDETDTISGIPDGYRQITEPPPYTQFQEQPPTYEEAVGHEDNHSIGTRSSRSSDMIFMW